MRGTRTVVIMTTIAIALTAFTGVAVADMDRSVRPAPAITDQPDRDGAAVTEAPDPATTTRDAPLRERIRERVHERTRPLCVGDDCVRPLPELRPILKRCIAWFLEHTTIDPHRRIAYWWLLCHRLWNHLMMV